MRDGLNDEEDAGKSDDENNTDLEVVEEIDTLAVEQSCGGAINLSSQ